LFLVPNAELVRQRSRDVDIFNEGFVRGLLTWMLEVYAPPVGKRAYRIRVGLEDKCYRN
jgi:hypothetical protein